MISQDVNLYAAFLGILLGTLLRTSFPALAAQSKAHAEGKTFQLDASYLYSAVRSLGFALVVVSLSFAGFQIDHGVNSLLVFLGAFAYGFMQNQVFNELLDWWREATTGS